MTENALDDLRTFLASRQWYADRGVPWRRTILLEGNPGTGKGSLARVIASELGFDLALLLLSDAGMTDERMWALFDAVPADTILLMEDVDCAFKPRIEGDRRGMVTLPGLLNLLDGVASRDGLIALMTTNFPEHIDPAILRPGRVDKRLRLDYASREQAKQMFRWFFGSDATEELADQFAALLPDVNCQVSPARLQEHMLRYRDPHACIDEAVISGMVYESRPPDVVVAIPVQPALTPGMDPNQFAGTPGTPLERMRRAIIAARSM
jgi:chaperone BCS1